MTLKGGIPIQPATMEEALDSIEGLTLEVARQQVLIDAMKPVDDLAPEPVECQFLLDSNGVAFEKRSDIRAWWVDEMKCDGKFYDEHIAKGNYILVQLVPTATMLDLFRIRGLRFDETERAKYAVK